MQPSGHRASRLTLITLLGLSILLPEGCRKRSTDSSPSPNSAKQAPVRILHPAAPGSFVKLVSKMKPSVVHLSTTVPVRGGPAQWLGEDQLPTDPALDQYVQRLQHSLGTGFIIDREGHLLTNAHLVSQHADIFATLEDGTKSKAKVIGQDLESDVALLKIETTSSDSPIELKPARLGDSTRLSVGEWVVAIGNPFGRGLSASAGLVSAGPLGDEIPPGRQGPWSQIQTDAHITPTNSGGPLVNMLGEVVGICTFKETGAQGTGFAIPITLAQGILDMLRREGKVVRAWLGIYGDQVTEDLAQQVGLKEPRGALVTSVVPRGPADRAGLRAGDIILSFDNKPLLRAAHLPWLASVAGINRQVPIRVWRDRKALSFTLKSERMPE